MSEGPLCLSRDAPGQVPIERVLRARRRRWYCRHYWCCCWCCWCSGVASVLVLLMLLVSLLPLMLPLMLPFMLLLVLLVLCLLLLLLMTLRLVLVLLLVHHRARPTRLPQDAKAFKAALIKKFGKLEYAWGAMDLNEDGHRRVSRSSVLGWNCVCVCVSWGARFWDRAGGQA